ncbi:hypothetical protein GQ457_15G013780 [Hibiscus cannabinus]
MYENRKLVILVSLVICYFPSMALGTSSEGAKQFVLVHGSCHGAWSLLKSYGHNVTAIDLARSGVDPQQLNTLRSISDYIEPLRQFMALLPHKQKVVLVGHSLGGLAISQAMEMFPEKISVAVFVTASMPGPTLNVSVLLCWILDYKTGQFKKSLFDVCNYQMDNRFTYDDGASSPPTTFTFGPMFLCSKVYQLSPPEELIRRFVWSSSNGSTSSTLVKWDIVKSSTHEGGLGFSDLSRHNKSLLLKLGFLLLTSADKLWVRVMKDKHKWEGGYLVSVIKPNCSSLEGT